jgi:hypothetical protein
MNVRSVVVLVVVVAVALLCCASQSFDNLDYHQEHTKCRKREQNNLTKYTPEAQWVRDRTLDLILVHGVERELAPARAQADWHLDIISAFIVTASHLALPSV